MQNPEPVTREILWNIPTAVCALMYALFAVSAVSFAIGIWRRIRCWQIGLSESDVGPADPQGVGGPSLRTGLGRLAADGILQVKIWRSVSAGLIHAGLFWGFLVLTIVTLIVALEDYHIPHLLLGRGIYHGTFYLVVALAADLFGVVLILACLLAIIRRRQNGRFRPLSRPVDAAILWSILLICVTGFLIEGLRVAGTGRDAHAFERIAPVGWILSGWFQSASESTLRAWHVGLWTLHMVLTMGLITAIPYCKLRHIFFAPAHLMLAGPRMGGKLKPVSIEQIEETGKYGLGEFADFHWRQWLSFDACTECARCQSVCPAHQTEKPLSPMRIVRDLADGAGRGKSLHGETIAGAALWACTSCRACVQECPVLIDQLDPILQMRRYLVGEGALGDGQAALRSIDASGNPWGLPQRERADWAEGLEVPTVDEDPNPELLFWVGCAGSYDRRSQKVSRALVKILKAAGIRLAILGTKEQCTGDAARRMGDEFTFQAMAERNVATLEAANPKRVVTACAHCFNTLKHEYPDFGLRLPVLHHTELIQELLRERRLPLDTINDRRIVFHDPCYLGRHNDQYDTPRTALRATGGELVEVPQSRASAFCCGAGGGRMWMDETIGSRINNTRWEQLEQAGAQTVATACPFCMTMLSDAAADRESPTDVRDVAELVAERLIGDSQGAQG